MDTTCSGVAPPAASPVMNALSLPVPIAGGRPAASRSASAWRGPHSAQAVSFSTKGDGKGAGPVRNPFSADQGDAWASGEAESPPISGRRALPSTPIPGLRLESLQAQDLFTRTYCGTLMEKPVVVKVRPSMQCLQAQLSFNIHKASRTSGPARDLATSVDCVPVATDAMRVHAVSRAEMDEDKQVVEDATFVRHSEKGEVLETYLSRSSPRFLARTVAAHVCPSGRPEQLVARGLCTVPVQPGWQPHS